MSELSIDFNVDRPYSIVSEMFWANHKLMSYRDFILDKYTHKSRLYHGLNHIASMWNIHKQMTKHKLMPRLTASPVEDHARIIYAILYHDIVYDAKAPFMKNEEDSGEMWLSHFHDQINDEDVDVVFEMIRATFSHSTVCDSFDELTNWFLDLDLSGLAAPYEMFEYNNSLIRLEYSDVFDFDFKRAGFLRALSLKDKIYRHDAFARFEEPARDNINRLLNSYADTVSLPMPISSAIGPTYDTDVQAWNNSECHHAPGIGPHAEQAE